MGRGLSALSGNSPEWLASNNLQFALMRSFMNVPLRILVVDDTAIYRKIVSDILRTLPGVEVVGTAIDGKLALEKIAELKPDLVTLDLEMPQLTGVEVLQRLRSAGSTVGVIMLSAFTSDGAAATTQALRLGAFDFVLKPNGEALSASMELLKQKLSERITAFAESRGKTLCAAPESTPVAPPPTTPAPAPVITHCKADRRIEAIVLGISTGGPEALSQVIPRLPGNLAAPLFIVQHMPPMFTRSLAEDLNHRSKLRVSEAVDGHLALPGDCLIAPGGRQMKIERTDAGPVVRITDDPPENSCRPAVDYLFRSAAHQYGGNVVAIVMTGMGQDGTLGCRLLKRQGAAIIAQNKETCVVFGMPSVLVEQGIADAVVPLNQIAATIESTVAQGAVACL